MRFSDSADTSASIDAAPEVAFTTSSPKPAASEKLPSSASWPDSFAHVTAASLPAWREPIITS